MKIVLQFINKSILLGRKRIKTKEGARDECSVVGQNEKNQQVIA